MAAINWPKQGTASLLGTRQDRIDGVDKASGAAKYRRRRKFSAVAAFGPEPSRPETHLPACS